jgi:hypothetical protein
MWNLFITVLNVEVNLVNLMLLLKLCKFCDIAYCDLCQDPKNCKCAKNNHFETISDNEPVLLEM